MYRSNALKERFRAGGHAYGAWVNSCSPIVVELMALAGYDCLMIDREHSPGDLLNAVNLLNAIRTTPTTALMRVPGHDPVELKRVLDIGVEGVMVPAVSSASEARAVVAACRYPPEGFRGIAIGVARGADYGFRSEEYKRHAFANLLLIVQIETVAAVEVVEEIAAVEGVDMLFIGPNDLSGNMGYFGQPDHPAMAEPIARIERAAKAAGKWLGGISTPARSTARLFELGYDLVLGPADLILLREAAAADVAANRWSGK
jgi:2-keto-3-deoxy-L-rhamnonate aldolase RhmA